MGPWPKTGEDRQLDRYWRKSGGTLYTEVCVGKKYWGHEWWGGASGQGRFDGILVRGAQNARFRHGRFRKDAEALRGKAVELIEVKNGLGEPFLGQALVGRWMFQQQVAEPFGIDVAKTVVLHRHQDPAMTWVAEKLNLDPVQDEPAPKKNAPMQNRVHYTLDNDRLARLSVYRESVGGLWFTRIPLGGSHCGVVPWPGASETWIPFVRTASKTGDDIRVYEPRHLELLRDPDNRVELVVVGAKTYLGRGPLGVAASHALMFEQQYGRAFDACCIVCGVSDPAVEAACISVGGTMGIPAASVFAADPSGE